MMPSRARSLPFLVVGTVAVPVIGAGLVLSFAQGEPSILVVAGWCVLGFALGGVAWKLLDVTLLKAVRRLAVEVAAATHGTHQSSPRPRSDPFLPLLPQAMLELAAKLAQARSEVAATVQAKTAELALEHARLCALLNEVQEGVVVCNVHHQMVLYNQAALRLLGLTGEIGLGRSFFSLVAEEPVRHAFDLLRRRGAEGGPVPFLAGTADGRRLLQGRMSLVSVAADASSADIGGYAVTLSDWTEILTALAERDALIDDLAAALEERETGQAGDKMEPERISALLTRARASRNAPAAGWWPMSDVFSTDLFEFVRRRLEGTGLSLAVIGLPVWVHGDSLALVLVLEALVRVIAVTGIAQFDLSADSEEGRNTLSLSWFGPLPPDSRLQAWRETVLGGAFGRVADVLARHGTGQIEVRTGEDGRSTARLALPAGREDHDVRLSILPARPEFFDFDLLRHAPPQEQAETALRDLCYVVFDLETTGLAVSQGDRIVSIAGVRIVNGRILTGELFDRLVDPGRPIPPESTVFHGITDALVVGKPPITVVLPQFKAFAADAVLVAHNAAFDLKFLRVEGDGEIAFDNPVLDTMLLSTYIDGTSERQSLDELAARYGVPVADRHTARGDALITAALLLRLIEALEAKGIHTLGQALDGLDMSLKIHDRMLSQP